jgi:hypothetical protein
MDEPDSDANTVDEPEGLTSFDDPDNKAVDEPEGLTSFDDVPKDDSEPQDQVEEPDEDEETQPDQTKEPDEDDEMQDLLARAKSGTASSADMFDLIRKQDQHKSDDDEGKQAIADADKFL